ncbi:MAG: flagellar biosynthesis protein FlhF [Spirochaetales bacterium]|nr:flagellar biosynthesis protein FlhF [Spirochaetales bacterium]
MQYFTIQAKTHREAIENMRNQYGEYAKILTYRNVRLGGVLGLFGSKGVELTGYLSNEEKPKVTLEEGKLKVLEAARKEQTLNYILKEIKELKRGLPANGETGSGFGPGPGYGQHPSLEKLRELMQQNDFPQSFANEMVERARERFSLTELEDFTSLENAVIDWIAEKIPTAPPEPEDQKPRVLIIVGPTGVGKTTTIAKLAALYGLESEGKTARRVRIVTIDSYRIGAKKQIEIYGEIMRIPVSSAETREDLKKLIALHADAEIILIDTIGKSQRDYRKLAEMKEILDGAGSKPEVHLAVSATTKTRDLEEIFQQYEPFGYSRVIVTKLDETSQIGSILSVVAKKGKPISFLTDGQKVPQDIEPSSLVRLLLNLEGFHVNRDYIENKYGAQRRAAG